LNPKPATRPRWLSRYLRKINNLKPFARARRGARFYFGKLLARNGVQS
jgi:hypothetical protein